MEKNFFSENLPLVIDKIFQYQFKRIVLQIPDDLLSNSIEIYNYFLEKLDRINVELYITADSTFGSSVDDISAEHINSDLLIYFGSDLSGTCSIPMMILPPQLPVNIHSIMTKFDEMLSNIDIELNSKTLLILDPSYSHIQPQLHQGLQKTFPNLLIGRCPPTGNIAEWTPESSQHTLDALLENIGGFHFSVDDLSDVQCVLYIGNKKEQLINILLRLSTCTVISCTVGTNSSDLEIVRHVGVNSREYRERYAGVLRVKDASIIGLIIGSMSITGELTRIVTSQLTQLIEAAGKKCYCFVMGRINEAKLCNFPEIDVFCLLSNDDNARIPAKTFHVPVVTPFEMELGLGARDWECFYQTSLTGNGLYSAVSDQDFQIKLEKVRGNRTRSSSDDSTDSNQNDTPPKLESGDSTTLTKKAESAMTIFNSAAAEYLSNREYRGLEPSIPENLTTEIAKGQYGIASSYVETTDLVNKEQGSEGS